MSYSNRHMLKYTICFIKKEDKILLLNREKPTWMGRWNGVGGKIQGNESPEQSVRREVEEETGLCLYQIDFKGIVSWSVDEKQHGGMYLYLAKLPDHLKLETPIKTEEGILDWKEINWILHPKNEGVADSIPKFLLKLLHDPQCYDHHCIYINDHLSSFESIPFEPSEWMLVEKP